MKKIFTVVALFTSLFTLNSQACMGGFVKLNQTDSLAADGLYGPKGLTITIQDMKTDILKTGRAVYTMDFDGAKTHRVEYLGSIGDKGGVISSSYLVLNFQTREEKVLVVKSNYQGNGISAKGVQPAGAPLETLPKQLNGFTSLYGASCN